MSNKVKMSFSQKLATTVFVAAAAAGVSFEAEAACQGNNGQSQPCPPPPGPEPIPSNPSPGAGGNGTGVGIGVGVGIGQGGQGGHGGQGGAGGNASSNASASNHTNVSTHTSATGGSATAHGGQATIEKGAINNSVSGGAGGAGGAATIEKGAVNNTVSGGSSTIEKGAVTATNTANGGAGGAATIEKGAVTATNTATGGQATGGQATGGSATGGNVGNVSNGGNTVQGGDIHIDARQAKQATHVSMGSVVGNLDGCIAQSALQGTVSVVGVGAIGLGGTTGASVVEGCHAERRVDVAVGEGIRSDDPAKIVIGYRAAGLGEELKHLRTTEGQDDMALFARRPASTTYVERSAPPSVTVVLNGAAQPAQATLPPCVIPGQKASWKQIPNVGLACTPDKN